MPSETQWSTSGGTLSPIPSTGPSVTLIAPSSGGSATVTATVRGASASVSFGVLEPSGVQATVRAVDSDANIEAFAGMYLDVVVQPTTVSFGQVQMMEIGEDATGISGYFVNNPPGGHTTGAGANQWHPIGCDNLIGDNMDHCYSAVFAPPWSPGGSFTWPIPAVWRVGNGATNSLPWSDQVFTLGSDGTVTVQKFGHSVTRTEYNGITAN